jgi:hypothetical protein
VVEEAFVDSSAKDGNIHGLPSNVKI